jgi:hypothetical protein
MANDLVVDAGLTEILNRMLGLSVYGSLYIAVGTATTPPVGTETALGAEIAGARVAVSTVAVNGNQANLKAFFNTAQANGGVGESGILTASSGGTLVELGSETPVQLKTNTQEMIVEKVITLTRQ